ncbi:potassium/sodium hyperpolarization-activated cyclic nucleotide-gated channel 1-like [Diprion similis]|uniref:potassium/sodium hyperpolarization-activated cyclic nucleotide-gated channel 1-like n=1 Tax=Diprion similis TaxID=362088 RepID=UPI001EF7EE89|nr:potassium/sodium hyperpolarization-activated cyclic nucleotide-gated channel 1-like [Diprion similis]
MNSTHNCTLSANDLDYIPLDSFWHWKHWSNKWKQWSTIDASNPQTKKYISSLAVFNQEKRRHLRMSPFWIIHPFSRVRFVWDNVTLLVFAIGFFTIPFITSFKVLHFSQIYTDDVNLYVYGFSWLGILMNCVTGVHDNKTSEIILEPKRIVSIYLKGFFFIDVFSSLPYDRLTMPWRIIPGPESNIYIPLINLLPNLKLFRFSSMATYIKRSFQYLNIKISVGWISAIFILYLVHWFACLCYVIPTLVINFKKQNLHNCGCWMAELGLRQPPISVLFRNSIFMAVSNFTGSSYGILAPVTVGHIAMCTLLMISGMIFIDYAIVFVLCTKSNKFISETKYEEIMNQLRAYMRQKQLPEYMKRRLLAYYYYRFVKNFYREKEISASLSDNLRREIALHSSRRFIQNVVIFRDLPSNVLESIVVNLKMELYLPNDVIIKAGTQGDCMFFLASGTVVVLTPTGKEICHLEDGAHFGEVALLVPDQRRVASVMAIEVCNVFRLERKDFRRCVAVHTDLFAKIERLATSRMEKTVLMEEQHKRFLLQRSNRRTSATMRNLHTKSLYPDMKDSNGIQSKNC